MRLVYIIISILYIFLGATYMFGLIEPNPISAGLFAIWAGALILEKYVIHKR